MLASRLKELRNQKNITQEELANHLSIPRGTYAHYELGKREPDYNMLLRIANFFDVSTDYLLGLTDSPNPYKSPKIISDLREGRVAYKDLSEETKKSLSRMDELPVELQDKINEMISTLLDIEKKNKKSN